MCIIPDKAANIIAASAHRARGITIVNGAVIRIIPDKAADTTAAPLYTAGGIGIVNAAVIAIISDKAANLGCSGYATRGIAILDGRTFSAGTGKAADFRARATGADTADGITIINGPSIVITNEPADLITAGPAAHRARGIAAGDGAIIIISNKAAGPAAAAYGGSGVAVRNTSRRISREAAHITTATPVYTTRDITA